MLEQALQFQRALVRIAEPYGMQPQRLRSLDIRLMIVDEHGFSRG
jgi:hypothetical protein